MKVFSKELVEQVVKEMKVADLRNATIGDVLLVASRLEQLTGIPFIRMDQGSPGLPANKIGIEAEKAGPHSIKDWVRNIRLRQEYRNSRMRHPVLSRHS